LDFTDENENENVMNKRSKYKLTITTTTDICECYKKRFMKKEKPSTACSLTPTTLEMAYFKSLWEGGVGMPPDLPGEKGRLTAH